MSAPISTTDEQLDDLLKNVWMIRKPCDVYEFEWKDCISRSARKHQRYTLGYEFDCSKWKQDFDNCIRFEQQENVDAAFQILENEKLRREERLKAAANNDVWEYRDGPPKDWSIPIASTEDKNIILKTYDSVERKSDNEITEWSKTGCSIM